MPLRVGDASAGLPFKFNFWVDPEAAHMVFDSGLFIEMAGWDISVAHAVITDQLAAATDSETHGDWAALGVAALGRADIVGDPDLHGTGTGRRVEGSLVKAISRCGIR